MKIDKEKKMQVSTVNAKLILLLLLFCSHTANVWGQNKLDELVVTNSEVEKEIKALESRLKSMNDSIAKFTEKLMADSANLKQLTIQKDSLEHLKSEANLLRIKKEADSLNLINNALLLQITNIEKDLEARRMELAKIEEGLTHMDAFKKVQKQNSFAEHMQYVRRSFSQMDSVELRRLSEGVADYQEMDQYKEYVQRLRYATSCITIYNDGLKAINSPYNEDSIVSVRLKIYDCLQVKKDDLSKGVFSLTKEQFGELDTLDIKLSRFESGMRVLKNTITEINADKQIKELRARANDAANKEKLCRLILPYVSPNEQESPERFKKHKRYFDVIPYLKKLLINYWEEINANPFTFPTETEQIIIDTKIEE